MKLDEIRQKFLDYFKKNGHRIVQSSPLIPRGDPSLLFTNAGMNQFKDVFLGLEKRDYLRAVSSQKCFRASGKHNDLENVGRTARHHTFFEMLGNFSFGDYFKKEAIGFAWEFMTQEMGLPEEKLWITVYQEDDEAYELWKQVPGVAQERILRMDERDNFWAMGDTGPCGPCSEIHYDQGPEIGCGREGCGIECECDRYLELWNLVFMQYDRDTEGNLAPLPRPSIDTGMGIERIAAVMQGVYSNYDIDLFRDIIGRIAKLTDSGYGEDPEKDTSMRVVADHARSVAFLIADGVLPANEGRGYVLRRVMRRAGRHLKMLGRGDPVFYRVADRVVDLMGDAYPELVEKRAFINEVVKKEEERFLETLDAGLGILEEEIESAARRGAGAIPGEVAFKLYDTYGFPLDLTENIAEEKGLEVELAGFEAAMQRQRERARESWKGSGEHVVESVYKEVRTQTGPTEFTGYESTRETAEVLALIRNGKKTDRVSGKGAEFMLVTGRTPFYGESGGQVGDVGLVTAEGFEAGVVDAKKPLADLIVHHCIIEEGELEKGMSVTLQVDEEKRMDTARNHSATHVLQYALRKVAGDHVYQKGSLVTPDRFRFDLTHFSPLTREEKREVETLANRLIRENHPVKVRHLPYKEAVERGAIALFGEKYGETVRMIEMGDFSRELCGGTHVRMTGDVGLLKILEESAVSAGVRRIEAVTGRAAIEHVQKMEDAIMDAAKALKASPWELKERAEKLREELNRTKKDLKAAREGAVGKKADLFSNIKDAGGVKVLVTEVQVDDPKELRALGDQAKDKMKSGVAVIGARAKGKAHLLAVVTEDLTNKIKAGDIVKQIAPLVGGKGGGRPDFAQAGGPHADKLEEALKNAEEMVGKRI